MIRALVSSLLVAVVALTASCDVNKYCLNCSKLNGDGGMDDALDGDIDAIDAPDASTCVPTGSWPWNTTRARPISTPVRYTTMRPLRRLITALIGPSVASSGCHRSDSLGISGMEWLAERARMQAEKCGVEILLAREGVGAEIQPGRGVGVLEDGTKIIARASICATGVTYRRLGLPDEARREELGYGIERRLWDDGYTAHVLGPREVGAAAVCQSLGLISVVLADGSTELSAITRAAHPAQVIVIACDGEGASVEAALKALQEREIIR